MKARPRVLFLINDLNFLYSHRWPIAREALERGYEVHIAGPEDLSHPKVQEMARQGAVVHNLPIQRSSIRPFQELKSVWTMCQILRAVRPDLVHLVTLKPNLYGGIVCRLLRVPCVVFAVSGLGHVFIAQGWRARLRRTLAEWLYRLVFAHQNSVVILQNRTDRDYFQNRGLASAASLRLIPGSGVDLVRFSVRAESKEDPVVLFASRLLLEKGIREWVQAIRILQKRPISFQAWLAGDTDPGNPSSIHREQVKTWQDEGLVRWLGHCEDMASVLQQCHIVCLPSYREGLPKILIEAAACQRAIITTNVPGCRDVVEHGISGVLIPPKDSGQLAEAIHQLVIDDKLRGKLANRARKRAENEFELSQIVDQTFSCYEELLSNRTLIDEALDNPYQKAN